MQESFDKMTKFIKPELRPLKNVTCIYCGRFFNKDLVPEKEHVIGRRFVPKGCLNNQWNLIVKACSACNRAKGELENDISAISIALNGRNQTITKLVDENDLQRKFKNSKSQFTGKPVSESSEEFSFTGNMGPLRLSFGLVAPPQIDQDRIFLLASYHIRAFFYMITYQKQPRRGYFVPEDLFAYLSAPKSDWGNPGFLWFMDLTKNWHPRLHAICAQTYFKIAIWKHTEDKTVWTWALEWNNSIRVIGFAGDNSEIEKISEGAPLLEFKQLYNDGTRSMRYREEIPLQEENDDLFSVWVDDD